MRADRELTPRITIRGRVVEETLGCGNLRSGSIVLAAALFLQASCTRSSTIVEIVVPDNYRGDVTLIEDPSGAEPERVGNKYIFRVPASGKAKFVDIDVIFDWHQGVAKYETAGSIPDNHDITGAWQRKDKYQVYCFTLSPREERTYRYLIGTEYDYTLRNTYKAVHQAVRDGSVEGLQLLIRDGSDVNEMNSDKLTPLHIAILRKDVRMLKALIRLGADTARLTPDGESPNKLAQRLGLSEVVKLLP